MIDIKVPGMLTQHESTLCSWLERVSEFTGMDDHDDSPYPYNCKGQSNASYQDLPWVQYCDANDWFSNRKVMGASLLSQLRLRWLRWLVMSWLCVKTVHSKGNVQLRNGNRLRACDCRVCMNLPLIDAGLHTIRQPTE